MLDHWSWSDDLDHTKGTYPMIFLLPFVGLCLESMKSISAPLGEWGRCHFFFWTAQACWKSYDVGDIKKIILILKISTSIHNECGIRVPVLSFASRSLVKSSFQSIKRMIKRIPTSFSNTQSFLSTASTESSINHRFIDWTVAVYLVISEYSREILKVAKIQLPK